MVGEMIINDAGLQQASEKFASLSEEVAQATSTYKSDGDALKGSWTGLGSENFSKSFDMIGQLMDKVSFQMESESQAVFSAKARFHEADTLLAAAIQTVVTSVTSGGK